MSLSKPFFNSQPSGKRRNQFVEFMDDETYKSLHWTEQLRLRPLRDRRVYVRESGDFDNRLDNWDDPEEPHDVTK